MKIREHPNIPSELVFEEILRRLPVKSLLRLRSVSKPWCASISDPTFVLKKPLRIAALKNYGDEYVLFDVDCQSSTVQQRNLPPDSNDFDGLRLLSSYNGLLLFEFHNYGFVLNPSTGKYNKLTYDNLLKYYNVDIGGICYDFSTRDFKVVVQKIPYSMNPGFDFPQMEFCSLSTKRWKQIEYPPFIGSFGSCGPVIDGKMHWLVEERENILSCEKDDGTLKLYGKEDEYMAEEDDGSLKFYGEDDEDRYERRKILASEEDELLEIFFFDAAKDRFVGLPSPDPKHGSKNDIRCLFDLDGCLAMVRLNKTGYRFKNMAMEVMVMKRYGVKESWTHLFTFSNFDGRDPYFLEPMSIIDSGELLISFCTDDIYTVREKVVAYNRKEDTYRDIFVPEEGYEAVVVYRESVLCLPDPTDSLSDDGSEYFDGYDYDDLSWYE